MLKIVNVSIHAIAAVHLSLVAIRHYNLYLPPEIAPLSDVMGGRLKYLTFWGCAFAAVYFCIALLDDLISRCKDDEDRFLTKIRDFLFFSVVFPATSVVALMFWGLYFVDPDLIFPEKIRPYIPPWFNHSLHTAVFVYALLELCTAYHKPSSKKSHLLTIIFLSVVYVIWYHIVYFKTGMWVYPVLAKLDWIGRGVLTLGSMVISTSCFLCGYYINNAIWRSKTKAPHKSKRK